MDAPFRGQQPCGVPAPDDEAGRKDAGFLAFADVFDFEVEASPLRPLEIHAQQHLDPVLSLHPTLAYRDRDHGVVAGVRIGEEQVELAPAELIGDSHAFLSHLLLELRIALCQLVQLHEVAGAPLQTLPRVDNLPVLGTLARDLARRARVIPRPRLGQLSV